MLSVTVLSAGTKYSLWYLYSTVLLLFRDVFRSFDVEKAAPDHFFSCIDPENKWS